MTPRTLRRKLQKKKKRKPYRKCPRCGGRATCVLKEVARAWHLFKVCRCGFKAELS